MPISIDHKNGQKEKVDRQLFALAIWFISLDIMPRCVKNTSEVFENILCMRVEIVSRSVVLGILCFVVMELHFVPSKILPFVPVCDMILNIIYTRKWLCFSWSQGHCIIFSIYIKSNLLGFIFDT